MKKEGVRPKLAALAFMLAALAMPRGAQALTADGALMTNSAWATFSGAAGLAVWYRTSYLASASVLVCNPVVAYRKTATPTMVAPTNTVTFTLCAINSSVTTSAFNLVLMDRLPDNMGYIPPWDGGWSTGGGTWLASYATGLTATFCTPNCQPGLGVNNTMAGAGGAYYLRWVVNVTGPGKSACVTYQASVL